MITTSEVVVGRLALTHVGARNTIESLDELSAEAKIVKLWLPYSRQQTLEAFDWSFARKRQTLATHGDAPPDGVWEFRYQYPADAVAARLIQSPLIPPTATSVTNETLWASVLGSGQDAIPYEIEHSNNGTRSILCNLDKAVLVYTFDQTNYSLWTVQAIEALSRVLASRIAFSLTGKAGIATEQMQMFLGLMRAAQGTNANERVEPKPRDAEWVRGR